MQTRELREYCDWRGWNVVGEYVDVGMSGANEKRPELERLMVDGHKRRFDAVEVWKFDRSARFVSHLLRALETFRSLGIEFVSFSEQMDTTTPACKMVFTVLSAVAELERSLIVERVEAGLRNARAQGKAPWPAAKAFRYEEDYKRYEHGASAGSRLQWRRGLGSESCIGWPERVLKFGKGFFELRGSVSPNLRDVELGIMLH
jgi:DNA invertase Pin-like site-specific DNA recombinase